MGLFNLIKLLTYSAIKLLTYSAIKLLTYSAICIQSKCTYLSTYKIFLMIFVILYYLLLLIHCMLSVDCIKCLHFISIIFVKRVLSFVCSIISLKLFQLIVIGYNSYCLHSII